MRVYTSVNCPAVRERSLNPSRPKLSISQRMLAWRVTSLPESVVRHFSMPDCRRWIWSPERRLIRRIALRVSVWIELMFNSLTASMPPGPITRASSDTARSTSGTCISTPQQTPYWNSPSANGSCVRSAWRRSTWRPGPPRPGWRGRARAHARRSRSPAPSSPASPAGPCGSRCRSRRRGCGRPRGVEGRQDVIEPALEQGLVLGHAVASRPLLVEFGDGERARRRLRLA